MTARSLLRMWLISCASTPASSLMLRRRSSPSVMPMTAFCGVPVGEGVERHARDDVDARWGRQLRPVAQHIDDVHDLAAVARIELARAIEAHDHFRRQARREGVDRPDRDQGDGHAHGAPDEPGREAGEQAEPADQQGRMQRVARLVRAMGGGVEKGCHVIMAPRCTRPRAPACRAQHRGNRRGGKAPASPRPAAVSGTAFRTSPPPRRRPPGAPAPPLR